MLSNKTKSPEDISIPPAVVVLFGMGNEDTPSPDARNPPVTEGILGKPA